MRICLVRQIIEQLKDVGKYTHCGNIGPCSRALNDEWRVRVTFRGKGDNIVATFRRRDRVIAWKLFDPSTSAAAFEGADVAQNCAARLRTLEACRHRCVVPGQQRKKSWGKFSAGQIPGDQILDLNIRYLDSRSGLTREDE